MDTTRRGFLGGAAALAAGVTFLNGGGRALAQPRQPGRRGGDPAVPPTGDPKGLSPFGFLLPGLAPFRPDNDPNVTVANLAALATTMGSAVNPGNPAGTGAIITYWGQFIDHDLTLDLQPLPQSPFTFIDPTTLSNFETFRFDLSSVYGGGPVVSPQLYASDGVHFLVQEDNGNGVRDLPRNPDGTAILVEHRNDENEIISQVHVMFLKFHNAVADLLGTGFEAARATVLRYYQWAVLHEFLPAIVGQDVVDGLLNGSIRSFYKPGNPNRPLTPVEWSTAAYRFGHSIIRTGYRLNPGPNGAHPLFNGTDNDLHGGRPLPAGRQIDFGNFINVLRRGDNNFQLFNLIDTSIAGPSVPVPAALFNLPIGGFTGAEQTGTDILALRNLIRGLSYGDPSGQDVAAALDVPVISPTDAINPAVTPGFSSGTPLWYYLLKEAEVGGGQTLGPAGARIVADVFLGLLKADKDGLLHDQSPDHGGFSPAPPIAPSPGQFGIGDLAVFAGVASRP